MNKFLKYTQKLLAMVLAVLFLMMPAQAETPEGTGETHRITSSYYQVDGSMIRGIAPGTTGEKLCKVCIPGALSAPAGQLATGNQLTYQPDGGTAQSLTVIVTADLNGDGKVSITDLLNLKAHLLGGRLQPAAAAAADVNYDGKVTITDFLRIKSNLLGIDKIAPGRTAVAEDPLVLLMPGKTQAWMVEGAAAYHSDDETVATVDATGTVTALNKEGSTFVRALNDQGQELDRAIVTVLNEALTVSFGQPSLRLVMGKSTTLTAQLNHPVRADISWSSSDPKVATVGSDGTVKSVKPGTATITAALSNGSKAQLQLTVASPVTALKTERTLYKIKPNASKKIPLVVTPAGAEEVYTWSSSNTAVAKVSNDGTVTGVKYGTAKITVTGKYSGKSASFDVKICDVKQVAITFDDGPSPQTPRLLDYLKKNNFKVTFFLVGNRMNSFSDSVKREVAEGHEIGYHSYFHKMQPTLSTEQIKSDFEKSNKILKDMTGAEFTVWRTPGGDYNTRVLQAVPVPHIMWSVDTLDWKNRNASSVYYSIMNNAKDGSIILMHDLYGSTVDGAIMAMDELYKGDYEFVTVTELLSRKGTPPQASTTYFRGP